SPHPTRIEPTTTTVQPTRTVVVNANGQVVPQEIVLPNGLRVILLEEHTFPVVSCLMWYRVGSANESPGATGLSHLVEHLLFQNIGNFRKNEFGASVVANGGQFNGFTSEDFTAFYSTVAPSKLDLVLRGEAERMRSAKFTRADVQPEVNALLREFDQETRDPVSVLNREVHAIAFQQHPYRNPPGGWRTDAERLTYEDARSFYDRFFYPDNAALVLVGDFTKETTLPLVKKYFVPIAKSPTAIPSQRVIEKLRPFERRVTMKYGGKKECLVVAYPAPAIAEPDAPAMTVLEKVLNGQISGRLKKQLVETRVCSSAQCVFEIKRDPSLIILTLNASGGTPLQKVLDASDSIVNQLRSQLVTDAELVRARKQAEFECFSETDGPYLAGFHLGYFETLMNWQTAFSWPEKIRSVNAIDLQRVARLYLSNDTRVIGQLVSTTAGPVQNTKPAAPSAYNRIERTILDKATPIEVTFPTTAQSSGRASKRFRRLRLAAYKESDTSVEPDTSAVPTQIAAAHGKKKESSTSSDKSKKKTSSTSLDKNTKKASSTSPDKNTKKASSSTPDKNKKQYEAADSKTAKGPGESSPAKNAKATTTSLPANTAKPSASSNTATATKKPEAASVKQTTEKTDAAAKNANSTQPTKPTLTTPTSITPSTATHSAPLPTTTARPTVVAPTAVQTRPASTWRAEPGRSVSVGSMSYKVLPNGMEVVVIESHLNPIVQVVGSVRAGSVFEAADKRGLSALTAQMMSSGKSGRQQIVSEQDDMGLPSDAMIKFDAGIEEINFQTRSLAKDFSGQLTRLVGCLREPRFQDSDIEKAKADLLAGISQSEDMVATKVERALLRSVMPSNSLYYPVDPSEKARSISTLKPSDVRDYYSNHVTPNLTSLVIAGDVQSKQIFGLLDHLTSGWTVKRDLSKPPVLTTDRRGSKSSLPLKDTAQSLVCLGRLISGDESSDKTWSDLLIADCALTNHPIFSRINQRLESEPNLAAGFRAEALKAHLQPLSEATIWSLYLPVDASSASNSVAAIQNELKQYGKTGLTVQELTEAKRYLLGSIPVNRMSNLESLSKFYLESLLQRKEPEPFGKIANAVRAATLDSVNKFIMNSFKPDQVAVVVAGNRQLIRQVHPVRPEAAEKVTETQAQ
ncbi:MAG: hypothetical protein C5B53_01265, partial [Candidatus Melainabacteria bacterium]